jgi:hypothetical protein
VNYSTFSRTIKTLKNRLKSIWIVIASKNFIIIYDIEEFEHDGAKGRRFKLGRRTNYDDQSDLLTLKGAVKTLTEKNNPH